MKPNPASHVIVTLGDPQAAKQLIVLCGMHGNEPAGKNAILRCLQVLIGREIRLAGQVVFLEGNLRAGEVEKRYVSRDLNRLWTREQIERLAALPEAELENEDLEQLELATVFAELLSAGRACTLLDLHTTSAESPPFFPFLPNAQSNVLKTVLENLSLPRFVSERAPILGTIALYLAEQNVPAIVIEGGGHEAESSAENLESAIWITLFELGILTEEIPELVLARERLRAAAEGHPPAVKPIYRHAISAQDNFSMRPGFRNFQKVIKGEHLADDKSGLVLSPHTGVLIFPLYQPLGEEGFLIAEVLEE